MIYKKTSNTSNHPSIYILLHVFILLWMLFTGLVLLQASAVYYKTWFGPYNGISSVSFQILGQCSDNR